MSEKMTKVQLISITGGKQLRSRVVNGFSFIPPTLNQPYQIWAESVSGNSELQLVTTSRVVSIEQQDPGSCTFTTENSKYRLRMQAQA